MEPIKSWGKLPLFGRFWDEYPMLIVLLWSVRPPANRQINCDCLLF